MRHCMVLCHSKIQDHGCLSPYQCNDPCSFHYTRHKKVDGHADPHVDQATKSECQPCLAPLMQVSGKTGSWLGKLILYIFLGLEGIQAITLCLGAIIAILGIALPNLLRQFLYLEPGWYLGDQPSLPSSEVLDPNAFPSRRLQSSGKQILYPSCHRLTAFHSSKMGPASKFTCGLYSVRPYIISPLVIEITHYTMDQVINDYR